MMASVHSTQGHRPAMEDDHCVIGSVSEKYGVPKIHDYTFFGLFDGTFPRLFPNVLSMS